MKINGSPAYVKTIQGLIDHQKKAFEGKLAPKQKLFKQPNPEMPSVFAVLQSKKKALEKLTADQTAKKIARGEAVTEEEREKLRATDPEKLRKADEANDKRRVVSQRLANAKSKEEAQAIIISEKTMAFMIYEKGDEQYGELLLEAIGQVEVDYYEQKKLKPAVLRDNNDNKQARLFDMRL